MRAFSKATAAALALSTCLAGAASGHPVDELIQGAYLTLKPGSVGLELDLTPGSEVVARVVADIDADCDGALTGTEARDFARRVLDSSAITVDAAALDWRLDDILVPDLAELAGAGGVIRIYATAERLDAEGSHELTYRNAYAPVKSEPTANIFLQNAEWIYQVLNQQRGDAGQSLSVTYSARPK